MKAAVEVAYLFREVGYRSLHYDAGDDLRDRQGPHGRHGNPQEQGATHWPAGPV